jgi:sugar diacid utilization regulator
VSRPGPARDRLADLLTPIAGRADLLSTLEGWFEADFDRRRAAAALHVHPNTLDYRLRRIAELTGLDPGTARGLQLLGAAVTAHQLAP